MPNPSSPSHSALRVSSGSSAVLALADGAVFRGTGVGADGHAVGEVVFNTAMSGYQEILTDPSYARQIVVFTHPHIGNTGATPLDDESPRAFAAAMVARAVTAVPANWRARQTLPEFLREKNLPAVSGVDARAVTRKLRDRGAQAGCVGPNEQDALAAARAFAGLQGAMLAAESAWLKTESWTAAGWNLQNDDYEVGPAAGPVVVVLDCGVKRAIPRELAARGFRVCAAPYGADSESILARKPAGVVFSNGPGDPEPCAKAAALAKILMARKIPLMGICLGCQILALALGGRTLKMKFGHHGANHPVRDRRDGRVLITSQNHGFAVDAQSLPPHARVTHLSLFDGSLQGFACDDPPAVAFQGHPEASPGPRDAAGLFDDFARMVYNPPDG